MTQKEAIERLARWLWPTDYRNAIRDGHTHSDYLNLLAGNVQAIVSAPARRAWIDYTLPPRTPLGETCVQEAIYLTHATIAALEVDGD